MSKGRYFCNMDLHIHTPKSNCFTDKSVTPLQLVEAAINAGLKAIAITDHNTAEWVDEVKIAAQGKDIVVFPGVEITVSPGIHVIALFPENKKTSHVNDLLTTLKLETDDRGKPEALIKKYGITEVISLIREAGALPILAHIDSEKGAWNFLQNQKAVLEDLWQSSDFAAVEIKGESLPSEIGKKPFLRIPAFYWASDNPDLQNPKKHSLEGIGLKYSKFKVNQPATWEGLRQCFLDPKSRISSSKDEIINHPTIESIKISRGFLNDLDIELTPNINCLIGGRGTGKSCLIELIRHTFGCSANTDASMAQAKSIIENTFPTGSKISINFRLSEHDLYTIEKYAGDEPRVFKYGDPEPINAVPKDILPIKAFGQKEIFEISKDPNFQLNLLDNFLPESFESLRLDESRKIKEINDSSQSITSIELEILEKEEETRKTAAIDDEINRMKQLQYTEKLEEKNLYDKEKEIIEKAENHIQKLKEKLENLLNDNDEFAFDQSTIDLESIPNKKIIEHQIQLVSEIVTTFKLKIETLDEDLLKLWTSGKEQRDVWSRLSIEQNERYQKLLNDLATDDRSLKADKYIKLLEQQRRIKQSLREKRKLEKDLRIAQTKRKTLLQELRNIRKRQYDIRTKIAEEISKKLNQKVRITICPQGNRKYYVEQLAKLTRGKRVFSETLTQVAYTKRSTPEREAQEPVQIGNDTKYLISEVPSFFDQIDFADAIRDSKERPVGESALTSVYGISTKGMLENLRDLDENTLYEIETISIPDLPIIELKVASGRLGYKPLDSLSIGQKCTALLSLILMESKEPLLIDQPEDDLDNQFIFDQIVTTLRVEKENRQFLIATHNANIPVSGDAELIMVFSADESHGWIGDNDSGSLDCLQIKEAVENILEGGKDAFKTRKERYGI